MGARVGPIYLFELASQQSRWLSVRQSAVAQNVANANTPGYKSVDVAPFETALTQTQLSLATTRPGHLQPEGVGRVAAQFDVLADRDQTHSGNNVSIEREFAKSGQISQGFALSTGLTKSFHRMMMMSVRV